MFLGIDLGTSAIKVVLINDAGCIVGVASHPLTVSQSKPRWSEQSPQDWWQGTLDTIDQLHRDYPAEFAEVRGIGLSGHMHGATLLDNNDRPLRSAILWNDTRSDEQCVELVKRFPVLHNPTGKQEILSSNTQC